MQPAAASVSPAAGVSLVAPADVDGASSRTGVAHDAIRRDSEIVVPPWLGLTVRVHGAGAAAPMDPGRTAARTTRGNGSCPLPRG